MKGEWIDGIAKSATFALRMDGPLGKIETETKAEGIIIAIGLAAGFGALAYGLVSTKYNTVTKAKPARS